VGQAERRFKVRIETNCNELNPSSGEPAHPRPWDMEKRGRRRKRRMLLTPSDRLMMPRALLTENAIRKHE
jgi:hypothetical protein